MLELKMYYSDLLEVYSASLTEKQSEIMDMYTNDDLGVAEIAENLGVSRQSVFDAIKKSKTKLVYLEEHIGFLKVRDDVNSKLDELIGNIDSYSRDELIAELGSIRIDR